MEKKTFKIIKNILLPIKSVIEVGPEGITNKKKFVKWTDIKEFSLGITSINGSMNYAVSYTDMTGKTHMLHFMHAITGSKKKKALFSELYNMIHEGIKTHLIEPKANELLEKVNNGETVEMAGVKVNSNGVEITKKKTTITVPKEDMSIQHPDGTGGFRVGKFSDAKAFQHFGYGGTESRYLLALLEKLYPEQAFIYK